MPTYVYACKSCAHRFEQYQSFSEDSLVTCPECSEDALRKVFDSVGIVFKGPGFYSTDSQKGSTSSKGATGGADSGSADSSGSSSSDSSSSTGTGSSKSSTGTDGSSSKSSSAGGAPAPAAAGAKAAAS